MCLCLIPDTISSVGTGHHAGMFLMRHRTLLLLGCISASCLAVPFSAIATFVKFGPTSSADRPNVTDWVQAVASAGGAIFTAAAFLAAAAALLVERSRRQEDVARLERQRAEDLARLEADQADRDVAQARLVMTTANFNEPNMEIVSIEVTNHSQHSLLDVELWLGLKSEASEPDKGRWRAVIQAVPAGGTFRLIDPPQQFLFEPTAPDHYVPWVEFVDARGLRWRRFNITRPIRVFDGAYDAAGG